MNFSLNMQIGFMFRKGVFTFYLDQLYSDINYFMGTNFQEEKVSRILQFLAIFEKKFDPQ